MYGAMIGDIVGSKYEFYAQKTKSFPLFSKGCCYTDDTVLTVAVARALIWHHSGGSFEEALVRSFRQAVANAPKAGYGSGFLAWADSAEPQPYNSCGNGSAMRVSPCGLYAVTLDEALELAERSAAVTHNHPEGIRGAQATAAAIFLARSGWSKDDIGGYICDHFYLLSRTLDEIRPDYSFYETCQKSVPQALVCFLESTDYEDAIRNAVSLGGDSDTLAAIAGSVAWAYYGRDGLTPQMQALRKQAATFLPEDFIKTAAALEQICKMRPIVGD